MTAAEMIKKYDIRLATEGRIGIYNANRAKKDKMLDTIFAAKPEIIAVLTAEKEAAEKAAAERKAKIDAIEGLNELKAAIDEHERYYYDFNAAMERGDGRLPARPTSSVRETAEKYPRAAAYLKAESYEYSANYAKSGAGKKARERIINGEDYEQVLADMEKEWSEYCNEHVWD